MRTRSCMRPGSRNLVRTVLKYPLSFRQLTCVKAAMHGVVSPAELSHPTYGPYTQQIAASVATWRWLMCLFKPLNPYNKRRCLCPTIIDRDTIPPPFPAIMVEKGASATSSLITRPDERASAYVDEKSAPGPPPYGTGSSWSDSRTYVRPEPAWKRFLCALLVALLIFVASTLTPKLFKHTYEHHGGVSPMRLSHAFATDAFRSDCRMQRIGLSSGRVKCWVASNGV